MPAAIASKRWSAWATALWVVDRPPRHNLLPEMAEFRFSFFLVLAATAAAISLLGWLLNGSARWAGVSVVLLIAGFVSGVLWQRKSRRARSATGESEAFPADVVNFSPDLLNATINEMREGLLVIDADMRV